MRAGCKGGLVCFAMTRGLAVRRHSPLSLDGLCVMVVESTERWPCNQEVRRAICRGMSRGFYSSDRFRRSITSSQRALSATILSVSAWGVEGSDEK